MLWPWAPVSVSEGVSAWTGGGAGGGLGGTGERSATALASWSLAETDAESPVADAGAGVFFFSSEALPREAGADLSTFERTAPKAGGLLELGVAESDEAAAEAEAPAATAPKGEEACSGFVPTADWGSGGREAGQGDMEQRRPSVG
jgi:hypothetical protein